MCDHHVLYGYSFMCRHREARDKLVTPSSAVLFCCGAVHTHAWVVQANKGSCAVTLWWCSACTWVRSTSKHRLLCSYLVMVQCMHIGEEYI